MIDYSIWHVIWAVHSLVSEHVNSFGYDAVYTGNILPPCKRNLLLLSSEYSKKRGHFSDWTDISWSMIKMVAARFSSISITNYQLTRRRVAENLNLLQILRKGILKVLPPLDSCEAVCSWEVEINKHNSNKPIYPVNFEVYTEKFIF